MANLHSTEYLFANRNFAFLCNKKYRIALKYHKVIFHIHESQNREPSITISACSNTADSQSQEFQVRVSAICRIVVQTFPPILSSK